jgi:hypothetical protein
MIDRSISKLFDANEYRPEKWLLVEQRGAEVLRRFVGSEAAVMAKRAEWEAQWIS